MECYVRQESHDRPGDDAEIQGVAEGVLQRERTDWLCQLLISKVSNGGYREASKSLERVDFISKSVVAPQWGGACQYLQSPPSYWVSGVPGAMRPCRLDWRDALGGL